MRTENYKQAVLDYIRLDAYAEVLSVGKGFSSLKKTQIARALGINRNTVSKKINELLQSGDLVKVDKGYEVIVPDSFLGRDIQTIYERIIQSIKF